MLLHAKLVDIPTQNHYPAGIEMLHCFVRTHLYGPKE